MRKRQRGPGIDGLTVYVVASVVEHGVARVRRERLRARRLCNVRAAHDHLVGESAGRDLRREMLAGQHEPQTTAAAPALPETCSRLTIDRSRREGIPAQIVVWLLTSGIIGTV